MYLLNCLIKKESDLETGDAIQAILAKCREVKETKMRVRRVCVCVFPHFGWQLSGFLTNMLFDPAWLHKEVEVTVG